MVHLLVTTENILNLEQNACVLGVDTASNLSP